MKKKITYKEHKFVLQGCRKKFTSIPEIQQYIIDEKILPVATFDKSGNSVYQSYYITEKLEKVHELTLDKPVEKSEDLITKFIDKVIKRIESSPRKVEGDFCSILHSLQFRMKPNAKISECRIVLLNPKLVEHHQKFLNQKVDYFKKPVGFIEFILSMLKSYNDVWTSSDVDLTRIYTDYKPCNGICLKFGQTLGDFYIILRNDDVIISQFNVYGRNVNLRKSVMLQESDLNDF